MRTRMVSLVILAVMLGLICALVRWGMKSKRVWQQNITVSFSDDVAEFMVAHDDRLPVDWREFEGWQLRRFGKVKWRAAQLERRLELEDSPYQVVNGAPLYIRVTAGDRDGSGLAINRRLHEARMAARKKKSKKQVVVPAVSASTN